MERQRQTRMKREFSNSWIIWTALLVLVFSIFVVFHLALKPMNSAKKQTIDIAKKYGKVNKITEFYSTNLNKTYYSVAGVNQAKQKVYVMVAKKGGHITVLQANDGVTEDQIKNKVTALKPQKIVSIGLTKIKDKSYWLAGYIGKNNKMNYVTYKYSNGNLQKTIKNV